MLAATIGSGANLFILIAVLLIAFGAGLTTTDFLKTKEKEKAWDKENE